MSNFMARQGCNWVTARRKTPPSSPCPCTLSPVTDLADDEHGLSPAGPAPSARLPQETPTSPTERGLTLLQRIEHAATRGTASQPGMDRIDEEAAVLQCISPDFVLDDSKQPQMVQGGDETPAGGLLQHVQHSKAGGDRWPSEAGNECDTAAAAAAAGEDEGSQSGAGDGAVHVKQQAAALQHDGDQTAAGLDLEQVKPRPRQVSRRGRGRGRAVQGKPVDRKTGMPVTLDSDRFGFVKLPSLRYC